MNNSAGGYKYPDAKAWPGLRDKSERIPHTPMQVEVEGPKPSALSVQVGGGHYKDLAIQPVEYMHANNIPFMEGSVIKYVSRWRNKGGIADLNKAKHFIELLIELEQAAQKKEENASRNNPSNQTKPL